MAKAHFSIKVSWTNKGQVNFVTDIHHVSRDRKEWNRWTVILTILSHHVGSGGVKRELFKIILVKLYDVQVKQPRARFTVVTVTIIVTGRGGVWV